MVKNVRWLYNKLGTVDISGIGNGTVSSGLNTVQSGLNGKADSGHTHGVGDLPVSNSQVNSTSYVPSSSVTYSLNTLINELGTEIDEIRDQVASTVIDTLNTTYESKNLGTWSSASDVDTFLSRFNHNSFYSDGDTTLALGNYVTIQDGTYNVDWEIAGFDMEYNQTADDGTVYDNGYGICLIPKTYVTRGQWNYPATTSGGYISSNTHISVLPNIVTTLSGIFENHIVNRNVLLSNSTGSSSGLSKSYVWTTTHASLMSGTQLRGTSEELLENRYDEGEANYKLPLFDYENYWYGEAYWLRTVSSVRGAWIVSTNQYGGFVSTNVSGTYGFRPLIYIR